MLTCRTHYCYTIESIVLSYGKNGTILGNANGCVGTVVVIVTAFITVFLSYFSTSIPIDPQLGEEEYPFALAEGIVDYSFRETLNCQFTIAGNIEFLDENVIDQVDQVILVQPLGTYDDRPPAIVRIGSDTRFGENGWSQLLVGNYWYYVWVHDLAVEVPLSEKILVDGLDCASERTLALVNFRQVLPFR